MAVIIDHAVVKSGANNVNCGGSSNCEGEFFFQSPAIKHEYDLQISFSGRTNVVAIPCMFWN